MFTVSLPNLNYFVVDGLDHKMALNELIPKHARTSLTTFSFGMFRAKLVLLDQMSLKQYGNNFVLNTPKENYITRNTTFWTS